MSSSLVKSPIMALTEHAGPEAELLVRCARVRMDTESSERVRALLQEEVDWKHLIWLAHRNCVRPLLYRSLNYVCPEIVPTEALRTLRRHALEVAKYNLVATRELLLLLDLLAERKIPAIPFKGPLLATSIYGYLALREFGDLDILIQRHDASKADALLRSLGYRPKKVLPDGQTPPRMKSEPVRAFIRNDGLVPVDLHWGLTRTFLPFQLDEDGLWERLEPVSLVGRSVSSLPAEDMLLVLCMHGSRHLWSRLQWICDVAELLNAHQGMDWPRVMEQATALGSQRMLLLGLSLASHLLGAALPETASQKLQTDQAVRSLAAQVPKHLFTQSNTPAGAVAEFVFHVRVRERLQDKAPNFLNLMRRIVTPMAKDRAVMQLPTRLSFLYYVIRPIRLVGMYGFGSLKRLTRSQKHC